jgi:hypothetical protein
VVEFSDGVIVEEDIVAVGYEDVDQLLGLG